MRFQNKVALVTGAANGIGEKTAARLVREGARVVLADVDVANGERVAAQLNACARAPQGEGDEDALQSATAGPGCPSAREPETTPGQGPHPTALAVFVRCDVRQRGDIAHALAVGESLFGGVDVVVNNAAVQSVRPLLDTSPEEWEDVMATNLTSVFHSLQLAVPFLRRRGGGSIVNVSSTFALVGSPGYAAYHASKGGVSSLTRAAAVSLLEHNIRVNAVCPGTTLTPGLRFGTPEEVADVIVFLASDEARFMVGANVVADGGYTVV